MTPIHTAADAACAARLRAIVGDAHVLADAPALLAYARDRLPFGTFRIRAGGLPGTMPRLVVCPGSAEEVARILALSAREGFAIVPYGAGSGVLGGAIPVCKEVVVDLKRLNRLLRIDAINGLATVEAGMNGARFEAALGAAGWTAGHLPQSLHMSTVGGWAACRGAGQASTRYGKIEDIVVGLKAVLPDGRPIEVRPIARRSVGPSLRDLFVGSEGALGIITELTLRIWRKPEVERGLVLACPDLDAAWTAAREILQAELRPAVLRIYDAEESRQRCGSVAAFATRPILLILEFAGSSRLAAVEQELSLEILARQGCVVVDDAPYRHWRDSRYLSYSSKWQTAGHYMDTIEITGAWSALPEMYRRMRGAALALHADMHFGAHWSHAYAEGACQYMTLRLPPMDEATALALHARAWDEIQGLTVALGGSIAHHHGVGAFRGPWMRAELGTGLDVLQAIKDALDPGNLLNPGKLGLRPAPGAVEMRHG